MCAGVWISGRMRAVLRAVLLALVSVPRTQAVWLGRLDPKQLLGSWYVLAVASGEKGFALEKATKNIEGVMVTLTPENNLKMLSSRHRPSAGLCCSTDVLSNLRRLETPSGAWALVPSPLRGPLKDQSLGAAWLRVTRGRSPEPVPALGIPVLSVLHHLMGSRWPPSASTRPF
uniref:epididymal-specific lipocalin-6 isoform X2 n=1 Tax=Halichoerus grypus TaxID=9711 RepID=UPI00165913C4|nr:epididymal-specific lipocalin-6 isoform X2 [Halichoerus grypus]